jgi:2-iminobutanoate/2-iminopropanoate deaminase
MIYNFVTLIFQKGFHMHVIQTPNAPAAIGPYSQAMVVGDLLFTSGQIPLRADGTLNDGDIAVQTTQVLANLKAVIEAAGASLNKVVKTTVFLKNLDDFVEMNKIYGDTFGSHTPARSTVQVAKLPRDVLVEIEAIVSLA